MKPPATINDLCMLVHHMISLGPRPDSGEQVPDAADLELQAAWDAAWNALVERARNLGLYR
jgi:hypothetical protein